MKECPECYNGQMAPKSLCDWCCGVGLVCESCNEPADECTCFLGDEADEFWLDKTDDLDTSTKA